MTIDWKRKYEELRSHHDEVSQAYHMLANIVNKDRHIESRWIFCHEKTCELNLKKLLDLEISR